MQKLNQEKKHIDRKISKLAENIANKAVRGKRAQKPKQQKKKPQKRNTGRGTGRANLRITVASTRGKKGQKKSASSVAGSFTVAIFSLDNLRSVP